MDMFSSVIELYKYKQTNVKKLYKLKYNTLYKGKMKHNTHKQFYLRMFCSIVALKFSLFSYEYQLLKEFLIVCTFSWSLFDRNWIVCWKAFCHYQIN